MTILIAAKTQSGNGIHLLSDSQTTQGSQKYTKDSKWSEFTNFYIGIAGDTISKIAIREFINDFLNEQVVNSRKDVINIYKKIEEAIKAEFNYKPSEHVDRGYLDFDIILVTKTGKIFTCGEFLCAEEEPLFATTGTGSLCAKGILNFIYKNEIIRKQELELIMNIAYEQDVNCGGPTHYLYLPIENNESTIV